MISSAGTIERARVLSGSPFLAEAALAAVERAKYTPYHLNGTAIAIETTITVNFRLGE